SVAGQVKEIRVKAGDKVKVGQTILSVDDGAAPKAADKAPEKAAEKAQEKEPAKQTAKESAPEKTEQAVAADKPASTSKVVDISRGARGPAEPESSTGSEFPPAPAAPSVRRTA